MILYNIIDDDERSSKQHEGLQVVETTQRYYNCSLQPTWIRIYILSENELQATFAVYGVLFCGLFVPRTSKGSASASYDLVE